MSATCPVRAAATRTENVPGSSIPENSAVSAQKTEEESGEIVRRQIMDSAVDLTMID